MAKCTVTVTFELETDEYENLDEEAEDQEAEAEGLVRAMFNEEADWPWECDKDVQQPKIEVKFH